MSIKSRFRVLGIWICLLSLGDSCIHGLYGQDKAAELDWQIRGSVSALDDPLDGTKILALEKIADFDAPATGVPHDKIAVLLRSTKNPRLVIAALRALGAIQAGDQADEVAALLRSENVNVRAAALDALGDMHNRQHLQEVVELLRDPSNSFAASRVLVKIQARDQSGSIANLLKETDRTVKLQAVKTLGLLEATDQAGEIAKLLRQSDPDIKEAALEALGEIQAKNQSGEVAKCLRDCNGEVKATAIVVLGKLQAQQYEGDIVRLLRPSVGESSLRLVEQFERLKKSATGEMAAFLRQHADEMAKLLIEAENIDSISERNYSEMALGALGDMRAIDYRVEVAKFLHDPDSDLRIAAIRALAAMHASDYAGAIVRLLNDSEVNSYAVEALEKLQATSQGPEIAKFLKDPEDDTKKAALIALRKLNAKDQVREVLKLFRFNNPVVRKEAAITVSGLLTSAEADEIVRLLKDSAPDVKIAALDCLEAMGAKDRAADIAALLRDSDPNVKMRAAGTLGVLQMTDWGSKIAELLKDPGTKDPNNRIRIGVLGSLSRMHATKQARDIAPLLQSDDVSLKKAAVNALGALQAVEYADEIAKLLGDSSIRGNAIHALGAMRAQANAEDIERLLQEPGLENDVLSTLEQLAPLKPNVLVYLGQHFYADRASQARMRFLCYYLSGGDPTVSSLLRFLLQLPDQYEKSRFQIRAHDDGVSVIRDFRKILEANASHREFANDIAEQAVFVTKQLEGNWSRSDSSLLYGIAADLESSGAYRSEIIRSIAADIGRQTTIRVTLKVLAVQVALWILLIFFYPKSSTVQAIFFWNPWVRRVFGLAYVDFCLTWIPFLRSRLLSPFREDLVSEARLTDPALEQYFPDCEVIEQPSGKKTLLVEAITDVRGHLLLEGDSGLGKSLFLRQLITKVNTAIVYLTAEMCSGGVLAAIQLRLKGKASDLRFLKSIVYSGGLRIIIDGLNEVSVETRHQILSFLTEFPKAHVLLATQPLFWQRPARARLFEIQPLSDDQIKTFLMSRAQWLEPNQQQDYRERCTEYLKSTFDPKRSEEDRLNAKRILSNPMDLSTAAQMLARGRLPDLMRLQEQQFEQVIFEYKKVHPGIEFPLKGFAESVYTRRLIDNSNLDQSSFFNEIQIMTEFKMVLEHHGIDADQKPIVEWAFRHDKIRDFFLMKAFLSNPGERIPRHLEDARFRGTYVMLASHLAVTEAKALRDLLVERAAETKDHNVADVVVQVIRARSGVATSVPVTQ